MTSTPAAAFAYDQNGNTTSKTEANGRTSYAWDFENRLISITYPNGKVVNYRYDPFGRRIQSDGAERIFVYDGDNLLEELNSNGNAAARYTQGLGIDEPLVGQRQPKIFYYEADGLGSITSLTDPTGAVAATYTYDSFGFMTASTGSATNWFRYTARHFDSSTALYYYRARYYDPAVGRYLSEDAIGFSGRDLHLYRFVRNNPGNLVDPLGLLTIDKNFPSDCLPSMQRALDVVRRVSKKDPRCNCLFVRIGDHRSLKELVEDPRITVHFDPEEGRGDERLQKAYTLPEGKEHIYIRPLGCRLGRWTLASALVHELTHITLTPGAGQEDQARSMEINCGFPLRTMVQTITVGP